jgi:hypothetical protein
VEKILGDGLAGVGQKRFGVRAEVVFDFVDHGDCLLGAN